MMAVEGKMTDRPLLVEPVPLIAALSPYVIDRPGVGPDLVLDFNESLASPAALEKALRGAPVNRYPDKRPLEEAVAARLGVDPECVVVTNGADDALERTVRSVAGPGRRAVLTTPTYGMIRRFAVLAGAQVIDIPWWGGDWPVDDVCRRAGDETGLVAVVSPSNPTGAVISREAFAELLERLPRALILLDQAYVDFTDPENDLTPLALSYPNVVVVRTFSKAWGAAGLRVGYAVGDPRVIDWLHRVGLPFPVATPSIDAALAAVSEGPDRERVARVREQREELVELLTSLGAEALQSQASFVFARFGNADSVWRGLGALGISVRAFPNRSDLEGWLRITLPGDEENWIRLERGLRTVLAPEGLLFDLDGVLVDVSKSYRRAIIDTAARWGITLTPEDVARGKAGGDAANDWKLTRRLLAERGVEVGLDEVTEVFEELYQGTADEPGHRRHETLRVEREILARLAAVRPLAVVTGRPRADAERVLSENDIDGFFAAVVCMEDAPAKPDPAPVRLALERLGVAAAWMVGDTVDDVCAARRADVLPIGVPAPGDESAPAKTTLEAAGAAVVLDCPSDLEGVLP
jgi:histidinol-phosphate aminotransferase